MKKVIGALALVAAIMVGAFGGTAHAAAFNCTGAGNGSMFGHNNDIGDHGFEVNNILSSTTCTGGSGSGWTLKISPQYKDSAGNWQWIEHPNGTVASVTLPTGGDDCGSRSKFNNGESVFPDVVWILYTNCGVFQGGGNSNDSYDPVSEFEGSRSIDVNGVCLYGTQAIRAKYVYNDVGGSGTDQGYTQVTNC